MIKNIQLAWISDLLAKTGIRFWVDSGTLLGLVREGKLMEGDPDIDLGIWSEDEPLLQQVIPLARRKGYKTMVRRYRGVPYKYKLIPGDPSSDSVIDINIFRRFNESAWCPLVYPKANRFAQNNPLHYIYGSTRFAVNYIFNRKNNVSVNRWPWTLICRIYVWLIPREFFEDIVLLSSGLPAPNDYEKYLHFRYGNWKVANKGWDFYHEDGGIKKISPQAFMKAEEK